MIACAAQNDPPPPMAPGDMLKHLEGIPSLLPGGRRDVQHGNMSNESRFEDCASKCAAAGYCCNSNWRISGNQFKSCLQACYMIVRGARFEDLHTSHEGQCGVRKCSSELNGYQYSHCSSCTDLTSDPKCDFSVRTTEACDYGATIGGGNAARFSAHWKMYWQRRKTTAPMGANPTDAPSSQETKSRLVYP